jgi:acetyl-CoA synthetase
MHRTFRVEETIAPPEEFVEQANVTDEGIYEEFEENWPTCWDRAADLLDWERPYRRTVREYDDPPYHRWFVGGRLNAAANCADRHAATAPDRPAIEWLGERGETRTYTYADLAGEAAALAGGLRELGVCEGDTVALYMPRVPELPVTMLACARLGAPHLVVYAGYSGELLRSFLDDAGADHLVTCDGYYYEGETRALKPVVDEAVGPGTETVVVDRLPGDVSLEAGQHAYDAVLAEGRDADVDPVQRDAEDALFLTYTSDTVGEPTGMHHATGGYLSYVAWTARLVLDVEPGDTYWCSAGIEWITGHSYIVYGPLALGATVVLYEGAPGEPDPRRPWEIIERYGVDQFYTTPTAIRTFRDWGEEHPASHDLSSLRLLGTVGQRIDPETWRWFYTRVGGERCPVVDTWWQAETGGIAVSTVPGICQMKPGSVGPPLPGIDALVVNADGEEVDPGTAGYLTIGRPWPGMYWPVDGQEAEYRTDVAETCEDWAYFAEDGATVDGDGYVTILGRIDDVINVGYFSKTRVHAGEIERAVAAADGVSEASVVCGAHDLKGEAPYAFVVPEPGAHPGRLRKRIAASVDDSLATVARPEAVYLTPELPRTDAGHVLRRVLEDLVDGEPLGDTSALRNPGILDRLAVEVRHRSSD